LNLSLLERIFVSDPGGYVVRPNGL
jgi:hypothetical protein